ncbi:MAG: hypothetical protein SFV17_23280 [Candidatus Obscuribacter sp.]|nr:hypothetical protein [Candidatus Melainabacteria bacterium]MDX1989632.1 hypothetical protein [Candidatus Obscuribacter sp.]
MGGREILRELNQRQTSGGYQVDGTAARVLEEQHPVLRAPRLSIEQTGRLESRNDSGALPPREVDVRKASKDQLLDFLAKQNPNLPIGPLPEVSKPGLPKIELGRSPGKIDYEKVPLMSCLGYLPGRPKSDSTFTCLRNKYSPW